MSEKKAIPALSERDKIKLNDGKPYSLGNLIFNKLTGNKSCNPKRKKK